MVSNHIPETEHCSTLGCPKACWLLSRTTILSRPSTCTPKTDHVNTWPITYVYAVLDLRLACGVAFLCALSCSAVGLYAFYVNNANYQDLFSTYIRATNDVDIRSKTKAGDDGADPLPKAFARSHVALSGQRRPHDKDVQDTKRDGNDDVELRRLSLTETNPSLGLAWTNFENRYDPVSPLDGHAASSLSGERPRTASITSNTVDEIHRNSYDNHDAHSRTGILDGPGLHSASHNTDPSH
jgi:hypothetical protein